jgi:hypothetical protein
MKKEEIKRFNEREKARREKLMTQQTEELINQVENFKKHTEAMKKRMEEGSEKASVFSRIIIETEYFARKLNIKEMKENHNAWEKNQEVTNVLEMLEEK